MNFDNKREDYEIEDVENYSSQKGLVFSHQSLVMKSMTRTIELCGHELTEGTYETHIDPIKKTTKIIYKEDTKKAFVTSVKICRAVMSCDFDSEVEDNINEITKILEGERTKLLKEQNIWWNGLNKKEKKDTKLGIVSLNFLHKDLNYYKQFVELEVDCYLEIFEELNKLTKRLHFYEAEEIEG